jgi:hypothetical protein
VQPLPRNSAPLQQKIVWQAASPSLLLMLMLMLLLMLMLRRRPTALQGR